MIAFGICFDEWRKIHIAHFDLNQERTTAIRMAPQMSEERDPASPLAAYKEIIDQLVSETSHGISERLVVEKGIFGMAQNDQILNSFVQSLSVEQRRLLAQMLHGERISAIGAVLAVLEWWVIARDVGFTFRGQPMPVDFAEGLLGDYVGRLDDWQWPEHDEAGR